LAEIGRARLHAGDGGGARRGSCRRKAALAASAASRWSSDGFLDWYLSIAKAAVRRALELLGRGEFRPARRHPRCTERAQGGYLTLTGAATAAAVLSCLATVEAFLDEYIRR